ncbi:flavodoxin family protein [Tersicoccus sp. Bi-70]|uniref:flavodoxin family protein n=1 Tax=Tersicoccus sp. Bi-70 TaxID=1897634 RepID=UPI000977FBD7|nr:NAD(P)H-dependent oxidoreductase [Tersicoccus sp. Bi-70]OMH31581.1 flavodoxin [Tersicoccus sp. Bi-70]
MIGAAGADDVLPGGPVSAPLTVLALVCSLKPSPARSSAELMARQVLDELATHGVTGDVVRVVDHDVKPGVELDMGEGDAWPGIRERLIAADIVLIATPTWMGQQSSVCQRVLERLDAELSETDDAGRLQTFGKVGIAAVVGNEDGAHHISAVLFQGMNDVGFTIPAQGVTYWNGEAMHATDYQDLDETPEATASTTATMAANAAHLARLLAAENYPASS